MLFNLKDIDFAYNNQGADGKIVMHIDNLSIPDGKVVFFVGPSGSGKSTVLEVLGLMNNTVVNVDTFTYKGEDMRNVWSDWSDRKMSEFRNKEFSFIFQDNNLMPNFTALENVMVTAMFQNLNLKECHEEAKKIFAQLQLDLPFEEKRSIQQYSGGQRQRLAFARAMIPKFNVLFGDEPTGNLDRKTAEDAMTILQHRVHECNVGAIIVSHDMRLADIYADMIVQIHNDTNNIGLIDDDSIFVKNNSIWEGKHNSYKSSEFVKYLEDSL